MGIGERELHKPSDRGMNELDVGEYEKSLLIDRIIRNKVERECVAMYVPRSLGLSHGLVGNSKVIVNLGMTHSTLYFSCAKTPQNYN